MVLKICSLQARLRSTSITNLLQWEGPLSRGALSATGRICAKVSTIPPKTCTFTPLDEDAALHLFGSKTRAPGADGAKLCGKNMDNALLISAKIKSVYSDMPFPVKMNIKGISGNRRLASGERCNYLIHPRQKSPEMNCLIAQPSPYLSSSFLSKYPNYTANNLMEVGVMKSPDQDFYYVSKSHPVIPMIRENEDVLQISLSENSDNLVDGKFFKIDNKCVEECCSALKAELSSLPVIDLANFSCTIERPYGLSWSDMRTVNCKDDDAAVKSIRNVAVELELTYAL